MELGIISSDSTVAIPTVKHSKDTVQQFMKEKPLSGKILLTMREMKSSSLS